MSIICRPVLLHNEYVPAMTGRRGCKYLVLGHHDGMTVGEAFLVDTAGSFEKIFSFNAEFEGNQANYSTQFFYGLHNNADREKIFWESDLPFTFVSFMQFDGEKIVEYQKYLESLQYISDEWKTLRLSEQLEDIRVIAYYALDSSDLILVIKCHECKTGTQMINNLHQNVGNRHPFLLRNSYSILAIDRSYIEESSKNALVEERVEWLELRIIERKNGSVNDLYTELESTLKERNPATFIERKGLMGTEDEAVIIQNARWKDLLPLYKEKTGILMNSNVCSQKYASAITTKMLYSIATEENNRAGNMPVPVTPTPFCDYLYHEVEVIYKDRQTLSDLTERKNLVMLINALRKTEYARCTGKTFNDYCFFTIMMPTAMFIRLRGRDNDNAVEFYDFIKCIKLCMQNFTKPDRVYQQITDFNIRYFDIPSKLVALYNAYIYYAKQTLNVGLKGQYEFLLCPGMNRKTEVKELYQGTDRKSDEWESPEEIKSHHLFRVEIPEAHIYNLKLMFFTLGHEVSHFVGRVIRKRGDRYESILKLTGRMTVIGLREQIGYVNEFDASCFENDVWESIEDKICNRIRFHIEGHLRPEYMECAEYNPDLDEDSKERIREQIDYYKVFYRHTSTLKILLNKVVSRILHFESDEIFGELIWKDVNTSINHRRINYESRKLYYEKQKGQIAECIEAFAGTKGFAATDLTLPNGIEEIMYLLEECYADISCILLLHMSLKDYLGNLVKILETTGNTVEEIKETKIITRVAIVMAVMSYEPDEEQKAKQCFAWKDDEVLTGGNEEIICLQEAALDFMHAYIENETDLRPGEMTEYVQRVDLDFYVLREIIRYLLKCRREFYQEIQYRKDDKAQKFYELAEISDMDEFFEKTTLILKRYEEDIYKEIQRLTESEEGNHGK